MKTWEEASEKARIERWENVLRVLQGLPRHERRKHWDMDTWGRKTDCGTVACAAGHCGLDPWFRRRGFKLEFDSDGDSNFWDGSPVRDFFGEDGCKAIFLNTDRRPVSQVIREVKTYLRALRNGEHFDAESLS